MEMHFSEIDNETNNEPLLNMPEKYWENYKKIDQIQTKKKKVSFDDILTNMNIVVNNKGVLQYMQPLQTNEYQDQSYQQPYQEYVAQQIEEQNKQPLDPSVKHSFIYNKYFKDYKDINADKPIVRVPKTMEEYKQMLIDDKIKEIEHKKRIAQIKPKKMLFTNNVGSTNIVQGQGPIQATQNNLRMMSFH
jgi:hypothetical protein